MENTNCLNCGAPLEYTETDYGRTSKCKYCGTEYHIDKLGRVEEYKVKIKIMGKVIDCYVNKFSVTPICNTYRNSNGELFRTLETNECEINLIGTFN